MLAGLWGTMPTWLLDLLRYLSALTPFLYGVAVYRFFHYLDGKASGQAKNAVRTWFTPWNVNHIQVSAAIVEFFDKLYGVPLLSWRGFRRSALFTAIVTVLLFFAMVLEDD